MAVNRLLSTLMVFYAGRGFIGTSQIITTAISAAAIACLLIPLIGIAIDKIDDLILGALKILINEDVALFCHNYLTFPGVMLHEVSHAFFVTITGGVVENINLFEIGKDTALGHITYRTRGSLMSRSLQHALGGCAPVISGLITESMMLYTLMSKDLPPIGVYALWYLMVCVACHSTMSKSDTINYLRGIKYIFLLLTAGFAIYIKLFLL